ncbi:MAG: Thioesterase [Magnetococcales bacterium]|nr:Thioesterase [Magnetococcales bacterium]
MIQLFCIPFAGGNVYSYQGFHKHVGDRTKTVPLEYPGRGRRTKEPLLFSIQELCFDLVAQMRSCIRGPYALFGHSMGAYLGYLAVRSLVTEGSFPLPCHMFVSGASGPSLPRTQTNLHTLGKMAFIAELVKYGGMPKELIANKELTDYFEPILRADFQAIETDTIQARPPLDLAITVMTGVADKIITLDKARAWQAETTIPITVHTFPGEHFFIFDHWPHIGKIVEKTLKSLPQNCIQQG